MRIINRAVYKALIHKFVQSIAVNDLNHCKEAITWNRTLFFERRQVYR
jgi:hypothetical protein